MECQVVIKSTQKDNSPKKLLLIHQTAASTAVPNEDINSAVFDNLDVRKPFVEIIGVRHLMDSVSNNYDEKNHHDQKRDKKVFFEKVSC